MIIKLLSRKSDSGKQLFSYIFRYVFNEENEKHSEESDFGTSQQAKFIIRNNVRSRSLKGFVREFQENESYRLVRRKDSVKLFHACISFSNKDRQHIHDKLLKDIAKKFISEYGDSSLFVGTKHQDKEHVHMHIAISGTKLNGRSSRISKQHLHHIKLVMDRYQQEKYPALTHSLPEHGKKKRLANEKIIMAIKESRQTNKKELLKCLETTYAKAASKDQFISQLRQQGHEPYFRNGVLQGVRFEGKIKFRLSRLGFDTTQLEKLGVEKQVGKSVLDELQQLRNGNSREEQKKERPILSQKEVEEYQNPRGIKALDQLRAIRLRGAELDREGNSERDARNHEGETSETLSEIANDYDDGTIPLLGSIPDMNLIKPIQLGAEY